MINNDLSNKNMEVTLVHLFCHKYILKPSFALLLLLFSSSSCENKEKAITKNNLAKIILCNQLPHYEIVNQYFNSDVPYYISNLGSHEDFIHGQTLKNYLKGDLNGDDAPDYVFFVKNKISNEYDIAIIDIENHNVIKVIDILENNKLKVSEYISKNCKPNQLDWKIDFSDLEDVFCETSPFEGYYIEFNTRVNNNSIIIWFDNKKQIWKSDYITC